MPLAAISHIVQGAPNV